MRRTSNTTIKIWFSYGLVWFLIGCQMSSEVLDQRQGAVTEAVTLDERVLDLADSIQAKPESKIDSNDLVNVIAKLDVQAPAPTVAWMKPSIGLPPSIKSSTLPNSVVKMVLDPDSIMKEPTVDHPKGLDPHPAQLQIPSREELLWHLRQRIHDSNAPVLTKALHAIALSVLGSSGPVDPDLMEMLDNSQRQTVDQFHQFLVAVYDQLEDGSKAFNRAVVEFQMDELFGELPLRIRKTALCSKVEGFGVYNEFDRSGDQENESKQGYRFLAAKPNKMIVYVELDNFCSIESPQGEFNVKLRQELTLYNESDGLAVWRNKSVEIRDSCRNRRKDLFLVELVELPDRLSVGRYRLKIRVSDLQGGTIDESTAAIEVVADQSLVRAAVPWK